MKKTCKLLLLLFLIATIGMSVMACSSSSGITYKDIESIDVDAAQRGDDFTGFPLESFDISQITLVIKYKDTVDENGDTVVGETIYKKAEDSMLLAEDRDKLKTSGKKTITLRCYGYEISYELKLYSERTQKYTVAFYGEDGETLLGEIQRVPEGGNAEQPIISGKSGYTFYGWIDMDTGKSVTLNNVRKNMRLKAVFVENDFKVGYYYLEDSKEVPISEIKIANGEKGEDYYPEPPIREGYEFIGWSKQSEEKFYARYEEIKYSIKFVYRKYTDGKYDEENNYDYSGKYDDSFTTYTVSLTAQDNEILPPDDYLPTEDKSKGQSDANDYKFAYWYIKRGSDRIKVEFPIDVSFAYETTFYAYYIDMNIGSDGLIYKRDSDSCVISNYVGEGGIIVIPERTVIGGKAYDVSGIGDGVFKSVPITEFAVSSSNKFFKTSNGVLYSKDGSVLYAYPIALSAKEVALEDDTEEIGPYAFYGAKNLSTVKLSRKLKYIRDYAFRECVSLKSITFTSELINIGEGAFKMSEHSALDTVKFEGTEIISIGDEAFYGLDSLLSISLPASLSSIGDGVFFGCSSLREVDATKNSYFSNYGGALYSADFRTLYVYPAQYSLSSTPEIIIHKSCRKILRGAFYMASISCVTICSQAELETYSIVCPSLDSVRLDFDGYSFNASSFVQAFAEYVPKKIYVKDAASSKDLSEFGIETVQYDTWVGLGEYEQDFGYTLTDDGKGVAISTYKGYAAAVSVPMTIGAYPVTAIADNAFNGNRSIESIEIPVAVLSIGEQAFMNCTGLVEVTVRAAGSRGFSIGARAFYGCSRLESFTLPGQISVSSCGEYAFDGTPILNDAQEFSIVGDLLLAYRGNSLSVTVPRGVKYIATDAFKECGFMTSVTFESGSILEHVDAYAFLNCTGLKQIIFPSTIRIVENYAFYGCDFLYFVNYLTVRENVTIGDEAYYQAGGFYGEKVLSQFSDSILGSVKYNVKGDDTTVEGIAFVEPAEPEITMAELFVGWYYDDRTYANRVVFPISVEPGTSITLYACIKDRTYTSDGFLYEKNDDGTFTVIDYNGTDEHVIIPETYMGAEVTGIGKDVFGDVVIEITIPNVLDPATTNYTSKIEKIGQNAFTNTLWYKNMAGDFVIYDNLLLAYKGNAKTVIVPNNVTVIADGAFKNNKNIEYVVLPEGVQILPSELFRGCTALKQVILGRDVTIIEEKVFDGCNLLSDINFKDLTQLISIAQDALDETEWLKGQTQDCIIINGILYKYYGAEETLHIPTGIRIIADGAFKGNSDLIRVYLPTSLEIIRESAFEDAISLNTVYLPADETQLTYIMENAFKNCFNLRVMNLENAVKLAEIGIGAFENCFAYTKLFIPAQITYIGERAFKSSGVENVVFAKSALATEIGNAAFMECRSLKSVIFEEGSILNVIGKQAFRECTALETFYNPYASISTLGDYAFYNCQSLSNVVINERAISLIGKDAVYRLGYISAQNKNMITFGNILVSYSGTEKIVEVPSNITIIYDSAFEGNTNVVELVFEDGSKLNKINDRAFFGCSSLQIIDFPETVEAVGYQIADGTVWYTEQLNNSEYIIINNTLVKYNINYTRQADIPDNVTKIIRGAFEGKSVYDIKIGSNVEEIEDGAFDGMKSAIWEEEGIKIEGWTLTMTSKEPPRIAYEMPLGNCVAIYLEDREAYERFTLDTQWRIQASMLKIIDSYRITYSINDDYAYHIPAENVHALYSAREVITKNSTSKQYVFVGWFLDAEFEHALAYPFILTSNTTIYAKCIDYDEGGNPGKFLLKEEGDGYTIVDYVDTTDKKVVIITKQAKLDIHSITGYLGYSAYSGTEYDRYVYNNEEGKFEKYDIYGSYPDGTVTYRRNTVIEEISFANNCTIELLGENCFAGLTSLSKVTIPASVKKISAEAFADCTNLREIVFEDGIENLEIEEGAFRNCTSLQTVTIPEGITTLENDAFDGCYSLRDIYLEAETPIVLYQDAMPFEIVANMKIYIPYGRKAVYSSAWQAYSFYLVETENTVND